ncbi:evolutionarily conserved signaling intermediate in Toll pathway, mitochondrial-like [Lycorma delicatula]|uniref:evolutionarily conserved signaling intermediate in Toll pathway, mitochondrial-like n=1 Tax=Lycorma delicatula TaxID=130591 RepID=UPI003F50F38C
MSRAIFRLSLKITGFLNVCDGLHRKVIFNNGTCFHTFNKNFSSKRDDEKLPAPNRFERTEDKSKETYLELLNHYRVRETHKRGHVEFIYAAMKYMKEFGVEKDLEVYKALIDVMPKGKFVAQNILQAEFMHYPKQQQCVLDLLEQMEYNSVIPDPETGEILINIFGERGYPVRKFMRMLYWMPKFKNISPWPLPQEVPKEPFDLAMLAIKRITSVDPASKISVHSTRTVEDAVDDTWIISAQSEEQQELLAKHSPDKPVYIEGGFRIWLRNASVFYFVLRSEPVDKEQKEEVDLDDVSKLNVPQFSFFNPPVSEVAKVPSVHEQEDGIYYAVCATGTSSKDSLLSWVRLLQRENPCLSVVPVLFTLRSPTSDLAKVNDNKNKSSEESKDNLNKS